MLIFPQLQSGAIAQLPLQRSENYRTLVNALSDGSVIRMPDGGFNNVRWSLRYRGLTADEVGRLQSLFVSAEGSLHAFTFVDPTANLLLWSDELSPPVWNRDPQLVLTPVQDAFGGTAGMRIANGAATAQSISQTTNAPVGLQYCFSGYLRSDTPAQAMFELGGATILTAKLSGTWRRWEAVGIGGTGEQVTFGLSIPAAATIEVCGLQAEAQPCAGTYKSSTATGGVFVDSRFDQDSLEVTATDEGLFACTVEVLSRL